MEGEASGGPLSDLGARWQLGVELAFAASAASGRGPAARNGLGSFPCFYLRPVLSDKAHTRVPNIIFDFIAPLLSQSERDCLLYIVRRTHGFVDPAGGRKQRDTISLEQFVDGIASGEYPLDLGTGLSRGAVRKALKDLEEKGLVDVRYSCLRCLWEGELSEEQRRAIREQNRRGPTCPRCKTSLTGSYALAELTPKFVVELLNRYDKRGRRFRWDKHAKRFAFEDAAEEKKREQSEADIQAEIERLRSLLWYPELVDKAIEIAESHLKSKKMSTSRKLNNFYKTVWELQEEYGDAPLMRYALEQTLRGPALRRRDNQRWHRYLIAVLRGNRSRFTGAGAGAGDTDVAAQHERETRALLAKAAELNGRGEHGEARALLSDILAHAKHLTHLFDGDREATEHALRLAFKQGSSDLKPRRDPHALDFYPEWDPGAEG